MWFVKQRLDRRERTSASFVPINSHPSRNTFSVLASMPNWKINCLKSDSETHPSAVSLNDPNQPLSSTPNNLEELTAGKLDVYASTLERRDRFDCRCRCSDENARQGRSLIVALLCVEKIIVLISKTYIYNLIDHHSC